MHATLGEQFDLPEGRVGGDAHPFGQADEVPRFERRR